MVKLPAPLICATLTVSVSLRPGEGKSMHAAASACELLTGPSHRLTTVDRGWQGIAHAATATHVSSMQLLLTAFHRSCASPRLDAGPDSSIQGLGLSQDQVHRQ